MSTSPVVKSALSKFANILQTLVNSSGMDSAIKDLFSGHISDALKDIESEGPNVESGVAQVVESTADAAIEGAAGPVAIIAVPLANQLLQAVNGNIATAIAHLVSAKGITAPTTVKINQ